MLPTHGCATSVHLLASAILHRDHPDISSWIAAASSKSSFLAGALNHEPVANFLLSVGLASSLNGVSSSERLRAVGERADRMTLLAVASMLLELRPPVWLPLAVVGGKVRYEAIPSGDLRSLEWLQPELNRILIDAAPLNASPANVLGLGVGRAAELVVLAALVAEGKPTIHVAEISDRFGYDIESVDVTGTHRWEVKGCTQATAAGFHLSRNEYEKCRTYEAEWTLIQVEFFREALVAESITAAQVVRIRELSALRLAELVPPDNQQFRWESSAVITPPAHAWISSELEVPSTLQLPSLDVLGHDASNAQRSRGTP